MKEDSWTNILHIAKEEKTETSEEAIDWAAERLCRPHSNTITPQVSYHQVINMLNKKRSL